MKVLELFCGTKSIGKEFEKRGHEVFSIDIDPRFDPSLCIDILEVNAQMILDEFGQPDIVWASVPCTHFSVLSLRHHWDKDTRLPKTEKCERSVLVLNHTVDLIEKLNPKYFYIENPVGMMRKLPAVQPFIRHTIGYCSYGDNRQKPTDIFTNNKNIVFKKKCKRGSPCHVSAPRGSRTGTQAMKNAIVRAIIPPQLCEFIAIESEK
jgi:site-specific DNA-cytosine methylase